MVMNSLPCTPLVALTMEVSPQVWLLPVTGEVTGLASVLEPAGNIWWYSYPLWQQEPPIHAALAQVGEVSKEGTELRKCRVL